MVRTAAFGYDDVVRLRDLPASRMEEIGAACAPHNEALQATSNLLALGSLSPTDEWIHFGRREA